MSNDDYIADISLPSADKAIKETLFLLDEGDDEAALVLLDSLHPADQAYVVNLASSEIKVRIGPLLNGSQWAAILEHLNPEDVAEPLQILDVGSLTEVMDEVRPEVAADILQNIDKSKATEAISKSVRAEEIIPLIAYPEETAGGLMGPVTFTISHDTTVEQAMAMLRHIGPLPEDQTSFFVVDEKGRLLGTVSLQSLVFAHPEVLTRDVMKQTVASVEPDVDQEQVVRLMERYDLAEVPVIDQFGRLLGTIPFQEVFDVAKEEATEDMYRLVGLGIGESVASTFRRSVFQRLPWLLLSLGTFVLAAAVIAAFESTIAQLVILAAFLPVVSGQGGAVGTQTLTLMVRSIALGEVSFRSARGIITREFLLGTVNGIVLGLIVGVVGFIWEDKIVLGLALIIAMTANVIVAALAGVIIPLGLRSLGQDPALASGVFLSTLTDIVGFAIFLGTATVLLQYF